MSVLRDWTEIKELLESDKIKQRAEGLSRCKEFLSSKRNFRALNENRNYSWLETLQTLFHIVIIERNASVSLSKKTSTADKRLEEAAQMVRWVAEKVHRFLSRKVAKALINHLTQMIAINGKVQSFALTYAKALRAVLSYPPHLEHLDERQWTDITMLSFSAAFGDPVKLGKDLADSEAMDLDEDDPAPTGAVRAGPEDEFALPIAPKRTAAPLEIELIACIEVVFRSNSSPFTTYAQAIFRKFLKFFRVFPAETTAHLPALTALNRALSELDLNDQRSMRRLGPHLWTPILALWVTKNALLKEQIVIALRYLFPFVIPYQHPHRSTNEPSVTARSKELYEAVLTEPTIRWRESYSLDLDHLGLGIRRDADDTRKAFEGDTFRLGMAFDEKDAVSWSIAELGADALARIYEVTDAVDARDDDDLSDNARGKRRRVGPVVDIVLSAVTDESSSIAGRGSFVSPARLPDGLESTSRRLDFASSDSPLPRRSQVAKPGQRSESTRHLDNDAAAVVNNRPSTPRLESPAPRRDRKEWKLARRTTSAAPRSKRERIALRSLGPVVVSRPPQDRNRRNLSPSMPRCECAPRVRPCQSARGCRVGRSSHAGSRGSGTEFPFRFSLPLPRVVSRPLVVGWSTVPPAVPRQTRQLAHFFLATSRRSDEGSLVRPSSTSRRSAVAFRPRTPRFPSRALAD